MKFSESKTLGRTGLKVGRLGLGSSYGAPAEAFEEAFERGCNYFYWGSMRKAGMGEAIKNICRQGKRDQLIVVVQSYSRSAFLLEIFCRMALKHLGLDYGDVLLLGWYRKKPPQRIRDKAIAMKNKGMFRFLAISSHNRSLFPKLLQEDLFDIFHIRYSAAHPGAETEAFPYLQGADRPGVVTYTATRWGQLLKEKNMPANEPAPAASDCYRFALSHPAVDVCLTGPKDRAQMRQALKSLELGPLNEEEMTRMRSIGDHLRKKGGQ